jgi:hypothetical protein
MLCLHSVTFVEPKPASSPQPSAPEMASHVKP